MCFGGTLLEVALRQNKLEEYIRAVKGFGMEYIEVSDGTVAMAEADKLALLKRLTKEFPRC